MPSLVQSGTSGGAWGCEEPLAERLGHRYGLRYRAEMLARIVPTHVYLRQARDLLLPDEQLTVNAELAARPQAHPVIPGTHGARKARFATKGRGKSGGVRVIYFYMASSHDVYLLSIYDKRKKSNLSAHEQKVIAGIIEAIRRDSTKRSMLDV